MYLMDGIKEKEGYFYSKDYDKFLDLPKKNKYIISPMPGWSTHCDQNHISPIIDWEDIINQNYAPKNLIEKKVEYF